MAAEAEEVRVVWREAERALNALPEEAPERPVIQIQVARLRRYHTKLSKEAVPASWSVLKSAHEAIAETRQILRDARSRLDGAETSLTRTERLMETWLLAEQALTRSNDPARRDALIRIADEARERYQAAIDELDPDLPN